MKKGRTNRREFSTQALTGADYTDVEDEFIAAMEEYQKKHHVRFPSFTEVLAVAKSLGYRKVVDKNSEGK